MTTELPVVASSLPQPPPPEVAEDVRGVCHGIFLTLCGCCVFSGEVCSSLWKDLALFCKSSRRAFCSGATSMLMISLVLVVFSFAIMVGATAWSSAYYTRHYARTSNALKANASRTNATALDKDAWREWREDPVRSYFPMQPRYWFAWFLGLVAVVAAYLQTPVPYKWVNKELLNDPEDPDEERYCLCQLNCFNRLAQITAALAFALDVSFSCGYLVMASTFIDDAQQRAHLFIPVYAVMAQLFVMSFAVLFMCISNWLAYKAAMAHTREFAPDEDLEEKMH